MSKIYSTYAENLADLELMKGFMGKGARTAVTVDENGNTSVMVIAGDNRTIQSSSIDDYDYSHYNHHDEGSPLTTLIIFGSIIGIASLLCHFLS